VSAQFRDASRIEQLRVPPQSSEAEQSVLGGCMLDPKALARIADTLAEDDFYRRDHQLIWRAICDLDAEGKPYDAVTLGEWFEACGQSSMVANGAYLIDLASNTPSAANIAAYAAIVRDKAVLRRIIEVGTQAVNDGFNPDGRETSELLDAAIRDLMALSKSKLQCEFTLRQAVDLAWRDAEAAFQSQGSLRGVTTGFARMDKRLGGWHAGDLCFIGARPSVGKTALMVCLALNAAKAEHAVGLISGEQSAMQIGQRSISSTSGVHAERMRNGDVDDEAWPKITEAMRRLIDRRVRIYDRSAPTLDEVCRVARRWRQEHGIEVLFVDYLQRIRYPRAQNRIDEVSEVARGLKTLARDLEIPVVCLAQVKAEVDKRTDKRPGLGDIANSDEATREADLIAFLYRDEIYDNATPDRNVAELNVEKYRHGPTGQFKLRFDGATMLFANLDERGEF
jgi:replicative DNA helicase